jgi:hypothetical protein
VGVLCVTPGSDRLDDAFPAVLCSATNDLTVIWNLAQAFSLLLFGRFMAYAILVADPNTIPAHKRLPDFLAFGMGTDTAVVLVAPLASRFDVVRSRLS